MLIEQARAEAAKIVSQARTNAEQEASAAMQAARDGLRAEVAALAVKGAEQILRKEIDAKAHDTLLQNLKNEL
jgi:F-type H+-transporting ATPase subunit b